MGDGGCERILRRGTGFKEKSEAAFLKCGTDAFCASTTRTCLKSQLCDLRRQTSIGFRTEVEHFFFNFLRNVEFPNKNPHSIKRYRFSARKLLEFLIGARLSFTAKNGLHRFRKHFRVGSERRFHGARIGRNLAETPHQRVVAQIRVGKGRTEIPLNGRVRKVSLKSRYRKFRGKVVEERVCYAKIPLAIFKINRIYLMRH